MSTNIPKNIGDRREAFADDVSAQRKIQLRNLEREAKESSVIWRQKQLDLYKTLIPITKGQTMAELITSEYKNNEVDPEIELQKGLENLLQFANQENAQYILDRLEPEQILSMNFNFPRLIREIKKNSKRIDKNIFIELITNLPSVPKTFTNNLSTEGQLNLDALTERQMLQEKETEAKNDAFNDYQAKLARQADLESAEIKRLEQIEEEKKIRRLLFTQRQKKLSNERQNIELTKMLKKKPTPIQAIQATQAIQAQPAEDLAEELALMPFEQEEFLPSETTPTKVRQTTIVPLSDTKKQPAQNTAPPNVIEAQAEELIELPPKKNVVTPKVYRINIDYNLLEPYLNRLSTNKEVLKKYAKDNYNIKYGNFKNEFGFPIGVSSLRTFIAEQQYMDAQQAQPVNFKPISTPNVTTKSSVFVKSKAVTPSAPVVDSAVVPTKGNGIRRIKKIIGMGKAHYEPTLSKRKYISDDKFYIDNKKLKDHILCIKYTKTESNLPMLRPQSISNDLKELIQDTIDDKFDNRIFKKLNESDKRVFKRFCSVCKLDIEIDDPDDKLFQQRFEILKGQFLSGNSSIQNKNELKRYILEAYNTNKIPRNEAMLLLYQISL